MTGTASADQEPICMVFGMGVSVSLTLQPKAWHKARPNLDQFNSNGVMSACVSGVTLQLGG